MRREFYPMSPLKIPNYFWTIMFSENQKMSHQKLIDRKGKSSVIIASWVILCILALVTYGAPTAHAATNCTPTNCNVHDGTFDLGSLGTNPCNGVVFTSDLIVVGNEHFSFSPDQTHFTATVEGQFTISDANGITYIGHTVDWFGGNIASDGHAEFSGTNNFHGTGTDGSVLNIQANTHVTILADGTITSSVSNVVCH